MKVYFDGQIIIDQVAGGISRYYANLASELNDSGSVTARIIASLHRNEHLGDQRRAPEDYELWSQTTRESEVANLADE